MSDFGELLSFVSEVRIRAPTKEDEYRTNRDVLVIVTRGKGERETFEGWLKRKANFDRIGMKYALVYIYNDLGSGYPRRIDIESPRITIFERKEK